MRKWFSTLSNIKKSPIFQSEYGPLINIRPHPLNEGKQIDKLEMIGDIQSGKLMHLIEKGNSYYLFENTIDYFNSVTYHNALKGRFLQKFTGTKKHPKNIYSKATTNKERLGLFRMVQNTIEQGMSRIGYHMLKDGTLNLAGEIPKCSILPELINDWKSELPEIQGFHKPDFFISAPLFHEALIGSQFENGVEYAPESSEKIIFRGSYGVTMPTQDQFENFDMYISEIDNMVKGKTILDIGTNSSVYAAYFGTLDASKIVKYDTNKYALKAVNLNIEPHQIKTKYELHNKSLTNLLSESANSEKFDFIISAPPLLHYYTQRSDSDFAKIHYDPKGKILSDCFEIASIFL